MTLVLNGSTGVSAVDGSASTPALQGNDTNTGVFFPAADTVGISTSGAERMRVDSSGNVGIGDNNPTPVYSYTTVLSIASNYPGIQFNSNASSTLKKFQIGLGINSLQFYDASAATERMRIDSSGNVGIGTSSPSTYGKLAVTTPTAGYGVLSVSNSAGGGGGGQLSYYYGTAKVAYVDSAVSNGTPGSETASLAFATINSGTIAERARITSGGDFQFNSGYGSVATAYGCRAWVNFNGTGTVAIRSSGNVTSITDSGVGDYTVNFTTAMPDINYSLVVSSTYGSANGFAGTAPTTTAARVTAYTTTTGAALDSAYMCVSIFR